MSDHEHDYRKLNDEAVFCRGCGDIKSAAPAVCTLPHYPIYPIGPYVQPYVPWWQPWRYPTITYSEVTTGSTVTIDNNTDNVTYTLGTGSVS